MRFVLPTQHVLYFGIQAKKGKLDASGAGHGSNTNIAEIHNQVLMMLGHEVFDPETSKRVLVDHAFIVAGGQITKQARNWLGAKLDASKRSQIMFMDREDNLNLYIVTNLPLPDSAAKHKPHRLGTRFRSKYLRTWSKSSVRTKRCLCDAMKTTLLGNKRKTENFYFNGRR